jgi:hypothetical protein
MATKTKHRVCESFKQRVHIHIMIQNSSLFYYSMSISKILNNFISHINLKHIFVSGQKQNFGWFEDFSFYLDS